MQPCGHNKAGDPVAATERSTTWAARAATGEGARRIFSRGSGSGSSPFLRPGRGLERQHAHPFGQSVYKIKRPISKSRKTKKSNMMYRSGEPRRLAPLSSRRGIAKRKKPKLIPEQSPLAFFDKSKHTISGHVLGRATPVRPLWAPHTTHVPPSSLLRSIVDRCNPPSKDSNILLILQSFHYYS